MWVGDSGLVPTLWSRLRQWGRRGADPYADRMLAAVGERVPVVTYSVSTKAANVHAKKLRLGMWETEVLVQTPVGALQIITPLIGRLNVNNILAAVATGLCTAVGGQHIPLKVLPRTSCFPVICGERGSLFSFSIFLPWRQHTPLKALPRTSCQLSYKS